jgi:hypothetical protein
MSLDDFYPVASDETVVPPSRFTRRQFVAATGAVATAALVGPSLAGATSSRSDSQTLTWLAWSGQSDKEFLGPFEKKYGATVKAKEYSGDDEMLALATTAPAGTFDVVHADAEYVSLLRKAGLLMPLNLADFPEVKSFFPEFGPVGSRHYFPSLWDKGNPYAFVLRFGLLELAYNTKYVKPHDAESYKVARATGTTPHEQRNLREHDKRDRDAEHHRADRVDLRANRGLQKIIDLHQGTRFRRDRRFESRCSQGGRQALRRSDGRRRH